MISPDTTLRAIALEQPATLRVFERYQLDYCCGGNRPLAEACAEKGIAVDDVIEALEQAAGSTADVRADLDKASLTELIHHIVTTHHSYVRAELPRLQFMARKVSGKHGPNHPELQIVARNVELLADEMMQHLMKEEQILFPYIEGMERARNGSGAAPHACFGTVESPIRMMIMEHESAAALLTEMRAATSDFTPWQGACPTSAGLYHAIDEFERDLHRHVHLENNLLFPRALEAERSALAAF
jgi:regulator of cell morphogenesis and NO signaling